MLATDTEQTRAPEARPQWKITTVFVPERDAFRLTAEKHPLGYSIVAASTEALYVDLCAVIAEAESEAERDRLVEQVFARAKGAMR